MFFQSPSGLFTSMDDIDKKIINHLQDGFPVSALPYQEIKQKTGLSICNMPKIKGYFVSLKLEA